MVAFARMDGVPYGSIHLPQAKTRTSARFRTAMARPEEQVNHGRYALLTAENSVAIRGGGSIVVDGRVIGAVGTSGGTSPEDAVVAAAIATPIAASSRRPEADIGNVWVESKSDLANFRAA